MMSNGKKINRASANLPAPLWPFVQFSGTSSATLNQQQHQTVPHLNHEKSRIVVEQYQQKSFGSCPKEWSSKREIDIYFANYLDRLATLS